MQFDFTEVVRDIKNNPVQDNEGPITHYRVVMAALLAAEQTPPEEKAKRFALAMKVERNPTLVSLTIDEVKVLKDRVGAYSPTLVFGRFSEFLDAPLPARES